MKTLPGRWRGVSFVEVRRMALDLPGVTERPYYGRPAFFVGDRFFAGYRDDIDALTARLTFEDRDFLIRAKPAVFFITDHYLNYPFVLVKLAVASEGEVLEILGSARESAASKGAVKQRPARAARRPSPRPPRRKS